MDRFIAHSEGKIEDVLMKVDKFIFPVDFIILDYEVVGEYGQVQELRSLDQLIQKTKTFI